jgi:hypothetical protein
MSCQCSSLVSPSGEPLPSISDVQGLYVSPQPCCDDNACEPATPTEGTTLANTWLDSCCHSTGLTILARVGDKLARFAGSGFLQLTNGKFSVVSSVPIRSATLWHRWWKPTAASRPILGEPLPYPHLTVGDADGNHHNIKGPDAEDAVPHWNSTTKEFTNKPISEIPLCQKGLLPRAFSLELTGYAPIPENGSTTAVRCLSTLEGSGLLWADPVPTVDTDCECAPQPSLASVVTALPFPDGEGPYTLKYSLAEGLYWSEDA